ncbi:PRC-barrel domain-containing protein, partial [Planosporangium flavigriseum]
DVVEEIGPPIAYLALREGTPVYDRDGDRVGVVEHVVADVALDIFHGLIVHTLPLPGHHLFAAADQVSELHERGVLLSVGRGDLHEPREPSTAPGPVDGPAENPLQAGLRRAWDWLSRKL